MGEGMKRHSQRGLTLFGVLVAGVVAAFVLVVGFRTVPVVNEYLAIKRILVLLADEADKGASLLELRRGFDRRAQIDDIRSVSGTDLSIDKSGVRAVIDVEYTRTIPLLANVSLSVDLHPSSEPR